MKMRTQERLYGSLFALPIIVGVLLFNVYPIATSIWYSFTSYNPLESSRDRMSANLEREIDIQLGMKREDAGNAARFAAAFEPVDFIKNGLQLALSEAQARAITENFDRARFASDLAAGRLDKVVDLVPSLKSYMRGGAEEAFPAYRPKFVGLSNYLRMLAKDQYFWLTLGNTVWYAVVVVIAQTALALVLANGANSKIPGVGLFKSVFFIPSVTSSSAVSMIFWMLYSKPGVINQALGSLGFEPVDWLNNPDTALPAVMAMNVWTTAGYFMIAFLAGIQAIPSELYESARIDGASSARCFLGITLPCLRPQLLYVVIMGTIGCLQVFDQIYYLIQNMRSATIAFYIYKNAFSYGQMGYASAIAVVLLLIILGVTALQRRFIKESLV